MIHWVWLHLETERATLFRFLMATQFNLADLFETVAKTVPNNIAIVSDSTRLTYAELDDKATRLAAALSDHGVVRGDKVGIYLYNSPAFLISFIAICKLGACPYNVNYRYRADELRYLFNNADSAVIIHGAEFTSLIREVQGDVPTLKFTVAVNDGSDADTTGSLDYDTLLLHEPAGPWTRGEDDLIIIYTGGTTGMPKGVMWPHRAFLFSCAGGAGYYNPSGPIQVPQDIADRVSKAYPLKIYPLAPLIHGASLWSTWSALLNGITVIINESKTFDAEQILDTIEREKANIVQIVGDAMATPIRDTLRLYPDRWSLDHVINFGGGGAVFSQHLKDELKELIPSASIADGMGSTETGIQGTAEKSEEGLMRLVANDSQQVIVDRRIGQVGELGFVARTGNIPVGYYNDPVKTADTFKIIEGKTWAVSGDAGRLDSDGMITVFGRGSTCINSGGEKIYPEEVEELLRLHPAIFDAVVTGQKDDRWGERVVAVVSIREGIDRPSLEEIKHFLSDRLAGYKIPKAVVYVDEVKRSPAGKQDYTWARDIATTA